MTYTNSLTQFHSLALPVVPLQHPNAFSLVLLTVSEDEARLAEPVPHVLHQLCQQPAVQGPFFHSSTDCVCVCVCVCVGTTETPDGQSKTTIFALGSDGLIE